jgi:hypothetical protein
MSAQTPALQDVQARGIDVDTKCRVVTTFGNDGSGTDVDTKFPSCERFGNDSPGFIRVRKRRLKGGHQDWRAYRARTGTLVTASISFDLVKAVRFNSKPRHKFVLGLGSQKDRATGRDAAHMLLLAIGKMKRHGLDERQRCALLAELIRKGVRRPTITECEEWNRFGSFTQYVTELVGWLRHTDDEAATRASHEVRS